MGDFLLGLFGYWIVPAFIFSIYFWFKYTDRSMAPIERRFRALGYGLIWPYFLVRAITGRGAAKQKQADRAERSARIIGDAPGTSTYRPPSATPTDSASGPTATSDKPSRISNPFD